MAGLVAIKSARFRALAGRAVIPTLPLRVCATDYTSAVHSITQGNRDVNALNT